ncbi:MAG TPA: BamA/TamA family outer membrane protein [Elusimicrobiales bacterium]|nr:BamA/TamA family outer membrane protein [Elusimicrobiales bacterium]
MKRFPYIFILIFALFSSAVFAIETKEDKKIREVSEIDIITEETKTQEAITKPLEESEVFTKPEQERSFIDKFFSKVVINTKLGPIFILPILDSSVDLGPNYGVMPIWAIRDKKRKAIGAVIAPSINYNEYLKLTLTYRHYLFPGDKQLIVGRVKYSTVVQRELFLRYFNPEFMGSRYRVNAEFHHLIQGKASYYGYGPNSRKEDRTTYSLAKTGEEFTVSIPLPQNLYLDFTHMFFRYKVNEGPVKTVPQLGDIFPETYAYASVSRDFMTHRFALFYDSTDHPTVPKKGTYFGLAADISIENFVSDYSYKIYSAQFKHYFNYKKDSPFITAVHALIQDQKGEDVPFYALPVLGESTGLRSVGDGRYVDGGKFVFNIEERITISRLPILKFIGELEISPFLDMGTVFGTLSGLKSENLKFGYGVAIRLVIKPQVVVAADFALGREGTNVIIHVGYPF